MSELRTFPLSAGLLEPKHVQAIGASCWVYLWFLNRVTSDEANGCDFHGIVLYGQPVSIQVIAQDLGIGYHSIRKHIARLVGGGYLIQKRIGPGSCAYLVTKSKKWAWKRSSQSENVSENGNSQRQISSEKTISESEIVSGKNVSERPCVPLSETNRLPHIRKKPQTIQKPTTAPSAVSRRGTRLPDDFHVTDEHREFANRNDLPDPDTVIDEFRDYWRGVPGQRGCKLDWDATFRNRLRDLAGRSRRRGSYPPTSSSTASRLQWEEIE